MGLDEEKVLLTFFLAIPRRFFFLPFYFREIIDIEYEDTEQ